MAGTLQKLKDAKTEQPTPQCLQRIQRDLAELHADPPPGVFVAPVENDITVLHAIIVGAWDTPLEGGFFHLTLTCPSDYPIKPPRARFMTGVGRASFNSHIHGEAICLSLLGTAPGPSWSPALNIGSLLVSIQSFLTEGAWESMRQNAISIAVCDTLEACLEEAPASPLMPLALAKKVVEYFTDNYAKYEGSVKAQIHATSGAFVWVMKAVLGDFEPLLRRLRDIKKRIDDRNGKTVAASQNEQ